MVSTWLGAPNDTPASVDFESQMSQVGREDAGKKTVRPARASVGRAVVAGPDVAVDDRRAVVVRSCHDDPGVRRVDRDARLVLHPPAGATRLHRRVRPAVRAEVASRRRVLSDSAVAAARSRSGGAEGASEEDHQRGAAAGRQETMSHTVPPFWTRRVYSGSRRRGHALRSGGSHTLAGVRGLARSLVALACVAPLVACGGGEAGGGELDGPLGYLPEDTGLVVVVPTDIEGDQLQRLDRKIVQPASEGRTLESLLREAAAGSNLSWEDDLKPLLGNPLVIGTQSASGPFAGDGGSITAAIETRDGEKLREVVEKLPGVERDGEESGADIYTETDPGGSALAIEGDTLVVAQNRATLSLALEQRDSSGGLTAEGLDEALADPSDDALVRARVTVTTLIAALDSSETAKLRSVPWFAALRTVGVVASFPDDEHVN